MRLRGWLPKVLAQFVGRMGQCLWKDETRWDGQHQELHRHLRATPPSLVSL